MQSYSEKLKKKKKKLQDFIEQVNARGLPEQRVQFETLQAKLCSENEV